MIQGTARETIKVYWNGTEKDLIERTDRHAHDTEHGQLDSLDLGDCMGFWIWYLHQHHKEEVVMGLAKDGFIWRLPEGDLKLELVTDNFEWDMEATELPMEFE